MCKIFYNFRFIKVFGLESIYLFIGGDDDREFFLWLDGILSLFVVILLRKYI